MSTCPDIDLVLRTKKGSPLDPVEWDQNFLSLRDAILEVCASIDSGASGSLLALQALLDRINATDNAVAQNVSDIDQNATDIASMTALIVQNANDIAINLLSIQQNSLDIAANASGVSANAGTIATLANDLSLLAVDVAANTAALVQVTTNTADILSLQTDVGILQTDVLTLANDLLTLSGTVSGQAIDIAQNAVDILAIQNDINDIGKLVNVTPFIVRQHTTASTHNNAAAVLAVPPTSTVVYVRAVSQISSDGVSANEAYTQVDGVKLAQAVVGIGAENIAIVSETYPVDVRIDKTIDLEQHLDILATHAKISASQTTLYVVGYRLP
jgi:hypothetical protein